MAPKLPTNKLPEDINSAVEELKCVEDTLKLTQQFAEKLKERKEHLHRIVYDRLKEEFIRTIPELPHDDLERLAKEEGALPLEAFIHEFEQPVNGQK